MKDKERKRPTQQENVRNTLRNRFVIFGRMAFPAIGFQPDSSRDGCYRGIKTIKLDFDKIASGCWLLLLLGLMGFIAIMRVYEG